MDSETPINKGPATNYSTILLSNQANDKLVSAETEKLAREPVVMTCPRCDHMIRTKTNQVTGQLTYLICILCALGCWCGLLPLIINDFKDVEHNCPKCRTFIGRHCLGD